ncbi:MAG: rod-binding protein [Deltaproteobacteria bacterium]|nr:MAG: rod-binding protein [Deltaproteobacteria bacterium]
MKTSPVLESELKNAQPTTEALSEAKKKKMMESAKKFESYFVGFVFEKAYEAIPKSDFLEGGQQDMYTGMFIEEVSNSLAQSPRGIGLADQIYRDMEKREGLSSKVQETLSHTLGTDEALKMGTDLAQIDKAGF